VSGFTPRAITKVILGKVTIRAMMLESVDAEALGVDGKNFA
jgi:hypothetical protein